MGKKWCLGISIEVRGKCIESDWSPSCHLGGGRKPNSYGFNFFWVLNQGLQSSYNHDKQALTGIMEYRLNAEN